MGGGVVNGDLVVMTPMVQGAEENVIRVERLSCLSQQDQILHIAGGSHTGIIIRKPCSSNDVSPAFDHDLVLEFTVFLVEDSNGTHKKESRQLRFWFKTEIPSEERHDVAQEFFKSLLTSFPKDYVGFIKRVLKLLQTEFGALERLEVDLRLVKEWIEVPSTKDYTEAGSEVESVTAAHVQDVLEHAYPNGLTLAAIATALRCSEEEIWSYLEELRCKNLVRNLESGEWLRVEAAEDVETAMVRQMPKVGRTDEPTVAIITALFVEKLAVDAMIDNKQTYMRYKTDGESNVYTLGNIGAHRVVATKLSAIGHSRAAMIAAGSITTRLLGGFQQVQHVLVVGVGGGVPHYTDRECHVRLGDVVVSASTGSPPFSYVYCDKIERSRGTGEVQGYSVKKWSPSNKCVEEIVNDLRNEWREGVPWSEYAEAALEGLSSATASSEYSLARPPASSDVLTLPLGDGDVATVAHPDEGRDWPRLHAGPVGAGRALLRDPAVRAEFAQRHRIRCYDADFDSVVESIYGNRVDSWALVRGVADYGDGMRNKEWQAYAALQAAALTKLIVTRLPFLD